YCKPDNRSFHLRLCRRKVFTRDHDGTAPPWRVRRPDHVTIGRRSFHIVRVAVLGANAGADTTGVEATCQPRAKRVLSHGNVCRLDHALEERRAAAAGAPAYLLLSDVQPEGVYSRVRRRTDSTHQSRTSTGAPG